MTITEDIVAMAWAARKDERLSDGALYGKLAAEIERLRAGQCEFEACNRMRTALRQIKETYGPNHGSKFCWKIACDALETIAVQQSTRMVECQSCGAPVRFGSCCDKCNEPSDH